MCLFCTTANTGSYASRAIISDCIKHRVLLQRINCWFSKPLGKKCCEEMAIFILMN